MGGRLRDRGFGGAGPSAQAELGYGRRQPARSVPPPYPGRPGLCPRWECLPRSSGCRTRAQPSRWPLRAGEMLYDDVENGGEAGNSSLDDAWSSSEFESYGEQSDSECRSGAPRAFLRGGHKTQVSARSTCAGGQAAPRRVTPGAQTFEQVVPTRCPWPGDAHDAGGRARDRGRVGS